MTVWVIQDDGKRDLSDAKRYGVLRPIFTSEIYPDEMDEKWAAVEQQAMLFARGFDADIDYICLNGSPLYLALVMYHVGVKIGIVGQRLTGRVVLRGKVRVLRFDKREGAYYTADLAV